MIRSGVLVVALLVLLAEVRAGAPERPVLDYALRAVQTDPAHLPQRFKAWLTLNLRPTGLPLSYTVPVGYFGNITQSMRPNQFTEPAVVVSCNRRSVPAAALNAYEFQTESFLASNGLNIYDGSLWAMSLTLLGGYDSQVLRFFSSTLLLHRTAQFTDIKGDHTCNGVIARGECTDPDETGACGFCYGDAASNADKSLPVDNAYFFRMISDVWSFEGSIDARCPDLNHTWIWNDYRPVLGENAWAGLIAPLQVAFRLAGGDTNLMDEAGPFMQLAWNILPAIKKMYIPAIGAVYYSPRNTYDQATDDIGSTVSVENNASLLAGLKMLLYIIQSRNSSLHTAEVAPLQTMIAGIEGFLQASFNSTLGYFMQGGAYDSTKQPSFTWNPVFAVDCQTWVVSVLGLTKVDEWFGAGAALKLWGTTKQLGGYHYDPTLTWVEGVGFTDNREVEIYSGEWSFGAINMLRVMNVSLTDAADRRELTIEARWMRTQIANTLEGEVLFGLPGQETRTWSVLYANKRYQIPFGWWANPIYALSSTGWGCLVDSFFNPFYLGGAYASDYPAIV